MKEYNNHKLNIVEKLKEIFVLAINDSRKLLENSINKSEITVEYAFDYKKDNKDFNIIDSMIKKVNNSDYINLLCENYLFDVISVDNISIENLEKDLLLIYKIYHKDTFDKILGDIRRDEYGKTIKI